MRCEIAVAIGLVFNATDVAKMATLLETVLNQVTLIKVVWLVRAISVANLVISHVTAPLKAVMNLATTIKTTVSFQTTKIKADMRTRLEAINTISKLLPGIASDVASQDTLPVIVHQKKTIASKETVIDAVSQDISQETAPMKLTKVGATDTRQDPDEISVSSKTSRDSHKLNIVTARQNSMETQIKIMEKARDLSNHCRVESKITDPNI